MQRIINILLAAAFLLSSCTFADVYYGEGSPADETAPETSFSVDWSQIHGNKPDRMYAIGSRVPNTLNYGYLLPEMSCIPDSSIVQGTVWENGVYNIFCINQRADLIISREEKLADISVSLPTTEGEGADVMYVSDAGEIFADFFTHHVNDSKESRSIKLTPKNLSQELTVRFNTRIGEDVTVESITATLSGIVSEVYPYSGAVNFKDLCSIALPVVKTGGENSLQNYEAKVNILGLFPPKREELTSGPGILQLAIATSSHLGKRTFHAGINLRNTLSETVSLVVDEENSCYNIAGPTCTLNINNTLIITSEAIKGDEKDGVDAWFNMEKIDIIL